MAQEVTVRRKHLVWAKKAAKFEEISMADFKDQSMINRARLVKFFDDNTGLTHVLKDERKPAAPAG